MSIAAEPETLKQDPETLMTRRHEQVASHHDRAQQFANESEHGDPSQKLCPANVQSGSQGDHHHRDHDFSHLPYLDAEKLCQIRSSSHRHRRNRGTQRPQIDPSRHPCPPLSHQPSRPGIESSCNGELRNNFSKHQGDQQLSQPNKQIAPEHRWTARDNRKRENRVHADHRRQVGEAQSKVRPQAHRPIKLGVIAQRFKLSGISRVCSRLSCHTILSTSGGREFWVALSLLGNICNSLVSSVEPCGTSVYPVVYAFSRNLIRAPEPYRSLLLGRQQPDLTHDCSHIVEIDIAEYFAIAHINHADASDRKLFPRLEHVLIGATKRPFDGAVAVVDISAHQLEFEIRNALQFGEEELAHFSLTVTNLAKGHVLIEDIVSEQGKNLIRVVGIPPRNPLLRHRSIPIRGGL